MSSKFAQDLLNRITYHTSTSGTDIAFENLKRLHPTLDTDNILALACIATNMEISEEDRGAIRECIRLKGQENMKIIEQIKKEQERVCAEALSFDENPNMEFPAREPLHPCLELEKC